MSFEYQTLDQTLALKLKVTTLLDQEIVGFIYTFSSSNEVLVLITSGTDQAKQDSRASSSSASSSSLSASTPPPPTNQTNRYRIINTSFIKSIQVLNRKIIPRPNKSNRLVFEPINIDDLNQFLQEQIQIYKASSVDITTNSTKGAALHSSSSQPHKSIPLAQAAQQQVHAQQQTPPAQQHQHQHRHQHNQKSIASQLHDKLLTWFGSENVIYGNQKHTELIIHNDIKLMKPFTNTQKNVQVLNKQTKHLPALTRALKQFWDGIDTEKKGG